jgi:hypothetical protein
MLSVQKETAADGTKEWLSFREKRLGGEKEKDSQRWMKKM